MTPGDKSVATKEAMYEDAKEEAHREGKLSWETQRGVPPNEAKYSQQNYRPWSSNYSTCTETGCRCRH